LPSPTCTALPPTMVSPPPVMLCPRLKPSVSAAAAPRDAQCPSDRTSHSSTGMTVFRAAVFQLFCVWCKHFKQDYTKDSFACSSDMLFAQCWVLHHAHANLCSPKVTKALICSAPMPGQPKWRFFGPTDPMSTLVMNYLWNTFWETQDHSFVKNL
jgi:hypothetical protein